MKFQHEKLRQERKNRNMTIKQLSELSDVSVGLISCIERGITNPSVGVLFKLCNSFHLSVDYFLPRADMSDSVSVLRREEQFSLKTDKATSFFVSPLLEDHGHSAVLLSLEPDGQYGGKHIANGCNELILVIEGALDFHYADQQYVIKEGDSVYFSSKRSHYIVNQSDQTVRLIWCMFKER